MTRPRRFTSIALAATLLGVALASVATPAGAHTPTASATCSTLSVSLQYYATSQSNPKPNSVTVTVDGAKVAAEAFGASFARDFAFSNSTSAHSWIVAIDAVDNGYDRTLSGTSTPCAPPVVKDAAAAVHTTPPTCTAAGALVLDGAVNATWSSPTGATGPGNYSVTATATAGHSFDDGKATRAFTGTLAGRLASDAPGCTTSTGPVVTPPVVTPPVVTPPRVTPPRVTPPKPVLGAKPAPVAISARTVTVSCTDYMVTTTTTTTTTTWVVNAAGTAWIAGAPVVTTASTSRHATSIECPEVSSGGGQGGGIGGDSGVGDGSGRGPDGAEVSGVGGVAGAAEGEVGEVSAESYFGSLAHSGADIGVAVSLAIALLAAGGILILRRRDGHLDPEDAATGS